MADEITSPDPSQETTIWEYAKKYKTQIALTTAASAASAFLAHRITLRVATDVSKEMLYAAGRENGALTVQNAVLLDFVNEKGLADDVRQFIDNLK